MSCLDCLSCNCCGCCTKCGSCGKGCIKMLLVSFNMIFWLIGVALIGIASYALTNSKSTQQLLALVGQSGENLQLNYLYYLLIGVGAFIFLVSFCGCCGAIRENRCMLSTYILCMLLVILAQLALGVVLMLTYFKIGPGATFDKFARNKFSEMINSGDMKFAGKVQKTLECCGVHSYVEYKTINKASMEESTVEFFATCCVLNQTASSVPDENIVPYVLNFKSCSEAFQSEAKVTTSNYLHTKGCYEQAWILLKNNLLPLALVALVLGVVELVGIVLACCLCRSARSVDDHFE